MKIKTGIVSLLFSIGLVPIAAAQETTSQSPLPVVKPNAANRADELFYDAVKARMLGNDQQEEELLAEFIKLKPEEPAAYYDLARLSISRNRADKATEYIKKAISLDGSNKWYKEQYANILALKNQYADAAQEFEKLAAEQKKNEDYLLKAALMYQRGSRYKEALNVMDKLIAAYGPDEDYMMQKEQLYLKMNDVDGAAKVLDQLIARNPDEPRYYALQAELYENNKQPDKAAAAYRKLQDMFPADPIAQLSLAGYYRKNNDKAKYEEYVKKAIVNKDLDAETQISLLLPYLQELNSDSSKRQEGMQLAGQLAEQHKSNAKVLAFYGDVLSLNDQREKAAVEYKKSLAIDPSAYSVWQQLLYSYTDRKNADSLIVYSGKALRLFPNQAVIHYLNVIGHFNKREYTDAIRSMNRAIDIQPEDNPELLAEMYSSVGDAYNTIKEYTLSDSSYEKAMKLDPKNPTVLNNYSYYLSLRGVRLDDAEKMSRESLQLRPNEATFMDTYGWILYKQGKYEKAKEYIRKAIDTNEQRADATVYEHLGDIFYKLNSVDKAVEYWRIAREKGSDNKLIDKKIQERKLYE
jgi:Tfp pilus assembly protein PilF